METKKQLKIIEQDDETYDIYIDGEKVHRLSYQDMGWEGLYDAIAAIEKIGEKLGAEVKIEANNI